MNILAFSAHPDDVEINCAGTLAKYAKQGHQVYIIHACTGDKGHFEIPPNQMGKIRIKESLDAGKVIGAKVSCLGYGDSELHPTPEALADFVRAIRECDPDVIITHTQDDYHMDHVNVSKLVINASFLASVPFYHPEVKSMEKVPQLYFMEPYTGFSFCPQEFVDITDTINDKLAMMKCHKSQITWLKDHDNLDILEYIKISSQYRGFQCGTQHAEGFIRYSTALRAVPGRFLP